MVSINLGIIMSGSAQMTKQMALYESRLRAMSKERLMNAIPGVES